MVKIKTLLDTRPDEIPKDSQSLLEYDHGKLRWSNVHDKTWSLGCDNGCSNLGRTKLGWKLPGNYPSLTCNLPNLPGFGLGREFDKTSLVDITGAEVFSQCGNYRFVPRRLL